MQYKVTEKHIYCEHRCAACSIFGCLKCGEYIFDEERTEIVNEHELVNRLNQGNCVINKVEVLC